MNKVNEDTPTPPRANTNAKNNARPGTNTASPAPLRMVCNTIRQYAKVPAKIPSVLCVTRLRIKVRRMREVYWLEANASATNVMENVTPMTVTIEPAIVANNWRAPSGVAPNRRGHWASHRSLPAESVATKATASATLTVTINVGMNQKLDRRVLQSCLNLCMVQLLAFSSAGGAPEGTGNRFSPSFNSWACRACSLITLASLDNPPSACVAGTSGSSRGG